MSDLIWYYARGDAEKGPLSTAQIKTLAAAGKIRPEDLVWHEGMESWVPASTVPDLLPNGTAKSKDRDRAETESLAGGKLPVIAAGAAPLVHRFPPGTLVRYVARALACAAFFTVLLTRGCERLSDRHVAQSQARITLAEQRHRTEWNEKQRQVASEIAALESVANRTPTQAEQLRALTAMAVDLTVKADDAERRLRAVEWEPLQIAAETAEAEAVLAAFGQEVLVLIATVCLAVSLLALSGTSSGAERWMSLAAMIVLLFAVYSGSAFR